MFKSLFGIACLVAISFLLVGCESEGRGFSLPPGDIDKGRLAFESLECTSCHSFRGADTPDQVKERPLHVILGGTTTQVRTYGDLVTSIINPSHRFAYARVGDAKDADGLSNMKNYNQTMTVQELVDIVTYLQTTYKVIVPQTHYGVHI